MLAIPQEGFNRSITKHNTELDVFCDWLEGCLLFGGGDVSIPKIADALKDAEVYDDSDFANEFLDTAFNELKKRHGSKGRFSPFEFKNLTARLKGDPWRDWPALSFCVLLSLFKSYRKWRRKLGTDYTEQGELFELLTEEAVKSMFPSWKTKKTGWSSTQTDLLTAVTNDVGVCLCEPVGNVGKWTKRTAKEAGLDLLVYRPFGDGRGGIPAMLFQCASGADWDGKVHTPAMHIWRGLIDFTAEGLPVKAFAMPFALEDSHFTRSARWVNGLLLDRRRLLDIQQVGQRWPSRALRTRIAHWGRPIASALPRMS